MIESIQQPSERKLFHGKRLRLDRLPPEPSPRGSDPWLIVIAICMLCGLLYLGASLFVPLTIALLAYLSLRPAVAKLCRFGVPKTLASMSVILVAFLSVALIATVLYSPVQSWMQRAPETLQRFRGNFDSLTQRLDELDEAEESVRETGREIGVEQKVEIEVDQPELIDSSYLINTTGNVLAFILAVAVLTFFMLASGDDLLNRILNVLPDESRRREVVKTIGDIQDNVGRYLAQISLINFGLAVAVTLVMWGVGMPTPILWGVLAGLFNFIPYVGPLGATGLVFLAAGSAFDSTSRAVLTAIAFWLVTAVEGQFVTPAVVGHTLKVGPIIVLVAVAFWGVMWGLPGVLLAVPMLIMMRQIFAAFESTFPLAVVLGEPACDPSHSDCEPVKEDQPIAEMAQASG
ncbi:AI-2E family transporter [Rhodopirellula sp. JC740]|uniref:AI-2E family transporter n=1 Tax=Rhodopirellula halodulae TaxID=2894198 RepID=A0ABS8NAV3_9BACT|nr:AI-2E family transporter [Rhodopirellula sp. JC740]MCC9640653.1 AI-2E family transporter [Rhodopirellula sp. JC740]